jgi:hypothetical protein
MPALQVVEGMKMMATAVLSVCYMYHSLLYRETVIVVIISILVVENKKQTKRFSNLPNFKYMLEPRSKVWSF